MAKLKLNAAKEVEMARIMLQLPRVDPKTGRRPKGSMTPAHKKLAKRLANLTYTSDNRKMLATRARQYYAARREREGHAVNHRVDTPKPTKPMAKRAKKSWFQRLLGLW